MYQFALSFLVSFSMPAPESQGWEGPRAHGKLLAELEEGYRSLTYQPKATNALSCKIKEKEVSTKLKETNCAV